MINKPFILPCKNGAETAALSQGFETHQRFKKGAVRAMRLINPRFHSFCP